MDRRSQAASSGLSGAAGRQDGQSRCVTGRTAGAAPRDIENARHIARRRAAPRARGRAQGRHDRAARRHAHRRHQPCEALLAEAEAHQGRPAPLLRDRRAAHPAGRRRSPARHEAVSATASTAPAFYQQRSRRSSRRTGVRVEVLPDDLDPMSEPGAQRFDRRHPHHAAVHDAARGDLAGSLVLARAVAARRRLRRARSRSRRPRAVRARARRGAMGARRAGVAEGHRRAEDVRDRAASTSTCRCRRARRTSRASSSARSSRPSSRRSIRRRRPWSAR